MSHKRRTDEEHKVFGLNDKHKHNQVIVKNKVTIESIPVPELIASNEEKLAIWNFICLDLNRRDLLSPTYITLIEMLVHDIVMYKYLIRQLENADTTYETTTGTGEMIIRQNPIFAQYLKIQQSMHAKLQALGMTPRDIIYTANPAATSQIEVISEERKKLNYFK